MKFLGYNLQLCERAWDRGTCDPRYTFHPVQGRFSCWPCVFLNPKKNGFRVDLGIARFASTEGEGNIFKDILRPLQKRVRRSAVQWRLRKVTASNKITNIQKKHHIARRIVFFLIMLIVINNGHGLVCVKFSHTTAKNHLYQRPAGRRSRWWELTLFISQVNNEPRVCVWLCVNLPLPRSNCKVCACVVSLAPPHRWRIVLSSWQSSITRVWFHHGT